jgi:hypothetical protein
MSGLITASALATIPVPEHASPVLHAAAQLGQPGYAYLLRSRSLRNIVCRYSARKTTLKNAHRGLCSLGSTTLQITLSYPMRARARNSEGRGLFTGSS